MSKANFRLASLDDAEHLVKIYAPYVTSSEISFETIIPTTEEFARRIEEIKRKYPYFVCEVDGQPVGYVYASQHYKRAAYSWNAEISVYISEQFQGKGIGRAFYGLIEDSLIMQNVKNMMAIISVPNDASVELCEYCGFKEAGLFPKAGFKSGKWCDVVQMEKEIAPRTSEPENIIDFETLEKIKSDEIREVIEKWEKYIRI